MKYTRENYTSEKYIQDKKLIDTVNKTFSNFLNYNPDDLNDFNQKRKILKNILGCKTLRYASNEGNYTFIVLEKCLPGQIHQALKTNYFLALKRIYKFGNPLKNPQSPFWEEKKNISKKVEKDGQLCLF